MTDKIVGLGASNLFGLGANFKPQNSGSPHTREQNQVLGADGAQACENMIDPKTDYDNSFGYCNDTPDIKTDLSTLLTTFGAVVDSKMVDEITINFEKGLQATVDVTGHQHDDNAHATNAAGSSDVSAAVPASAGFGVPDFGVVMGDDASAQSATLTFSWENHIDETDSNGLHWSGQNTTPKATLSMEILGLPTSQTVAALETAMGDWLIDTNGPTDDNQALDRFALTAHQYFAML